MKKLLFTFVVVCSGGAFADCLKKLELVVGCSKAEGKFEVINEIASQLTLSPKLTISFNEYKNFWENGSGVCKTIKTEFIDECLK